MDNLVPLTPKQRNVLIWMSGWGCTGYISPTTIGLQVGNQCGYRAAQWACGALRALVEKGLVQKNSPSAYAVTAHGKNRARIRDDYPKVHLLGLECNLTKTTVVEGMYKYEATRLPFRARVKTNGLHPTVPLFHCELTMVDAEDSTIGTFYSKQVSELEVAVARVNTKAASLAQNILAIGGLGAWGTSHS